MERWFWELVFCQFTTKITYLACGLYSKASVNTDLVSAIFEFTQLLRPGALLENYFWTDDIISEKGLISALYDKSKKTLFYFRVPVLLVKQFLLVHGP